ncbi:Solanesyl diphosphate synthase 2, chloroplastic [Linum grandiflorum]
MLSLTCQCYTLDVGRSVVDYVGCTVSTSNASADRYSWCNRLDNSAASIFRGSTRVRSAAGLVTCRQDAARLVTLRLDTVRCRSVSTKSADNGASEVSLNVQRGRISLAKLFEVVADDLLILNKNLKTIVGAENPVLMSAAEQIFGAGGKRMRPALVFLVSWATAQMSGLKELATNHRRLAEIIEMIHTASLIHDDVLDESDLRRGKETVHQLYGTRVAVLAGDFMFAQSSWYLANLENLEVIKLISQVIKDFASGEIKQATSLFNCDVELEEYLIKSYYKTASLVAASTKGASIFSDVDSSVSQSMFEYGKNLGLSFQVVDDILDFTQSAEQLGKPAGSDLGKGNLTAPVIFALQKEPRLRDIIESEFTEEDSLQEAIELVKRSGGIRKAQELAKDKADIAIRNLECLPPSSFRSALEEIVLYNLERIE